MHDWVNADENGILFIISKCYYTMLYMNNKVVLLYVGCHHRLALFTASCVSADIYGLTCGTFVGMTIARLAA